MGVAVPAIIGTVAALLALAACTAPSPAPAVTTPMTQAEPTPTIPPGPVLVPSGTAADNLPYFASIIGNVWGGPEQGSGRAYIDALVAAGFDKAAMQVTADQSTVGNAAESIQMSVRWGSECLVGQVGPATGQPVAVVLPGLADGGCLIGATRTIDW